MGRRLVSLLDDAHSEADSRGRHRIVLPPFAFRWFRVGGLGYILERRPF
jgi:maltose alpha-D-glucosyltransferase/alpha-amylase